MSLTKDLLDRIYTGYNYEIKSRKHRQVRVYVQKVGIYSAAEIVPLSKTYDTTKLQKEYSSLGYATKIRDFDSIEEAEDILFKEYFLDSPFYEVNKQRYDRFTKKITDQLPEGSRYEFVDIPYDFFIYENNGKVIDEGTSSGKGDLNLLSKINTYLIGKSMPVFIIIEAAAGFGKTCTAYELLRNFIQNNKDLLPFFTELSKNREARVFKYILLNEIDNHFPEGIKSEIVVKEIEKGKIPLIIDGFDELLSKDLTNSSSSFIEAGNMLSTIMEYLKQNAKIVITSRKTAIFDSESFNDWASKIQSSFIIARFTLNEPTIDDWIGSKKIKFFNKNEYDLKKLANPVLLNYIRNIEVEDLPELLKGKEKNLFYRYFSFLLNREIERQNLKFDMDEQLKIFRGLARFMIDLDFRSDTKDGIKEYFSVYCKEEILHCITSYPISERPSLDDMVETLSNHVFLDRKEQNSIGFINDFIFGVLLAQSLILDEIKLDLKNSQQKIGEGNCELAAEAYKVNSYSEGKKLWEVFNRNSFSFKHEFYFAIDCMFTNTINRSYKHLQFDGRTFRGIKFSGYMLSDVSFFNCNFHSCEFNVDCFEDTIFQNCCFYTCLTLDNKNWHSSIILEGCKSDNLIEKLMQAEDDGQDTVQLNDTSNVTFSDQEMLGLFFNPVSRALKNRSQRQILESLKDAEYKIIRKNIKELISKGYLFNKGDMYFISREGVDHYNSII